MVAPLLLDSDNNKMSETNVPAAEAEVVTDEDTSTDVDELSSYELAFHILPTVAEEEVPTTFSSH